MPIKIRLNVSDPLLRRALELMLSDMGFDTADKEDDFRYAISDDTSHTLGDGRTLYVVREETEDRLCLVRPFDKEQLDRMLKALLCVKASEQKRARDELHVDKKRCQAVLSGQKILLTEKETALLALLYDNKGKVVSDNEIVSRVWKNETVSDSNIAAVYVNYLRKKLDDRVGKRLIYRVRGEGYTLKINEKE